MKYICLIICLYCLCLIFLYSNLFKCFSYREFSYRSINKKLQVYHQKYAKRKYYLQALVLTSGIGNIFYLTCHNLVLTLILIVFIILILPYYNYLHLRYLALEKQNDQLFTFAQLVLINLQEKQTVPQALGQTAENLSDELQKSVQELQGNLLQGQEINQQLVCFKQKFPGTFINNVLMIIKTKYVEGTINQALNDYLLQNIAHYEVLVNRYRLLKKNNRQLFYVMIVLNCLAILLLTKTFLQDSIFAYDPFIVQGLVFGFYVCNIITIAFYELWYCKPYTID